MKFPKTKYFLLNFENRGFGKIIHLAALIALTTALILLASCSPANPAPATQPLATAAATTQAPEVETVTSEAAATASATVSGAATSETAAQAPARPPSTTEAATGSEFEALIPAAQAFIDQLAKGDFSGAVSNFDPQMGAAMPEAKMKETWQQLTTQMGPYQKQIGVRTEQQQGYRIVFVTTQFENAALDVRVVFDAQGKIAGLFFQPAAALPETTPGSTASLTKTAQTAVDDLAKGNFAAVSDLFDPALKTPDLQSKLQQTWQALTTQMGAYQQQTVAKTGEVQGYQAVYVTTQFENQTVDLLFLFNPKGQLAGMQVVPANSAANTPQAYQPPDYVKSGSFHEIDVTVGSGEWALPGTLTLPNGSGPFPAVVLVHGSGTLDRDETVGPNKPFRDLAWGLASQGIAVLRYDKRNYAHGSLLTPEIVAKQTVNEETVDDAVLAAQLLSQRPEINPKQIFILGHSLGATMAPRIAQKDLNLAGLVILAGVTRPLEDAILDQYTYLYSLSGIQEQEQQAALDKVATSVARVKDPNLSDNVPGSELPLGIPAAYWLDLRGYQPAQVAKSLSLRLLVLQGGRDYQVSPTKDFEGWRTALAGKSNATLKLYPDLNHLFIAGKGQPNPSEYMAAGNVSQEGVMDIAQWIKNH
jgi:dienelactone hydrolase